jgi:hypothetical protein
MGGDGGFPFYPYDVTYHTSAIYTYKEFLDLYHIHPVTFVSVIEADAIVDGEPISPALAGEQYDAWFEISASDDARFLSGWPILNRVEPDLLFGGEAFSGWTRFYATEVTGQFFQFRLCVASRDPKIGVRIRRAYVDVSVRVRVDGEYDVASPAEGMRITFDPAYMVPPAVGITQDSAQAGDRAVVTEKDRFGFNVEFVNQSGAKVARQFDWIARGYGREQPKPLVRKKRKARTPKSSYMSAFLGDNSTRGKL